MAGEEDYAPIELGKNKVVRVTKFKVKINYFSHSPCNKEMIKNDFQTLKKRNHQTLLFFQKSDNERLKLMKINFIADLNLFLGKISPHRYP